MKKINDLMVGWVDLSIGKLVQEKPTIFASFAFTWVTSLDSSRNIGSVVSHHNIVERYSGCAVLNGGLLVPGTLLSEISNALDLFNGFDEVWCFDSKPLTKKPDSLSIISPPNIEEIVPLLLVSWMNESGCRLALGDGVGLNYATKDISIAQFLQVTAGRKI